MGCGVGYSELNGGKVAIDRPLKDLSEIKSEILPDRSKPHSVTPSATELVIKKPNGQLTIQPPKNYQVGESSAKEQGEVSLLQHKKDALRERSEVSNPAQIHNSMTIKSNQNRSVGVERSTPKENSAIKIIERENIYGDDESLMSRDGGIGAVGTGYLNPRHIASAKESAVVAPRLISDLNPKIEDKHKSLGGGFLTFGGEGKDSQTNQAQSSSRFQNLIQKPTITSLEQQQIETLKARKAALQAQLSAIQATTSSLQTMLVQTATQTLSQSPTALASLTSPPAALMSLESSLQSQQAMLSTKRTHLLSLQERAFSLRHEKEATTNKVKSLLTELDRANQANKELRKMVLQGREGVLGGVLQGVNLAAPSPVVELGRFQIAQAGGQTISKRKEIQKVPFSLQELPKGIASLMDPDGCLRLKFLTLKHKGIVYENERILVALKAASMQPSNTSTELKSNFVIRLQNKQTTKLPLHVELSLKSSSTAYYLSQSEFSCDLQPQTHKEFIFSITKAILDELITAKLACSDGMAGSTGEIQPEVAYFCLPISISWFMPLQKLTKPQLDYICESDPSSNLVIQTEIRQLDAQMAKSDADLLALCPNLRMLHPSDQTATADANPLGQASFSGQHEYRPKVLFAGLEFAYTKHGCLQIFLNQEGHFFLQVQAPASGRAEAHKLAMIESNLCEKEFLIEGIVAMMYMLALGQV